MVQSKFLGGLRPFQAIKAGLAVSPRIHSSWAYFAVHTIQAVVMWTILYHIYPGSHGARAADAWATGTTIAWTVIVQVPTLLLNSLVAGIRGFSSRLHVGPEILVRSLITTPCYIAALYFSYDIVGDDPKFDYGSQWAWPCELTIWVLVGLIGLAIARWYASSTVVKNVDIPPYDVAISWGVGDETIAKRLAAALKDCGLRVYYSEGNDAMPTAGLSLRETTRAVYGSGQTLVLAIVSTRFWPRFELAHAVFAEVVLERSDLILPVSLDKTLSEIIGTHRIHLHWAENKLNDLILTIVNRVGKIKANRRSENTTLLRS